MTIVLQRKLLAHPEFLSMLVSGLLLAEDHPRLPVAETTHHWCQTMHAECLMQLAVFPEVRSNSSAKARSDITLTCVGHACERAAKCALQGKAALLQNPEVVAALEALAAEGLTDAAKDFGKGALYALSDTNQTQRSDADAGDAANKHVMLSCKSLSVHPARQHVRLLRRPVPT